MYTQGITILASMIALSLIQRAYGEETCSTLTTFNTGLNTKVPNYYERRKLIGDAIKTENADVICLQEMWHEDDMRSVLDKVGSVYPHHFSGIHTGTDKLKADSKWYHPARSACSIKEIASMSAIFPCALTQGCIVELYGSINKGMGCLADKCGSIFRQDSIDANCVSCLIMSFSSIGDFADRCHKVFGKDNRLNPSGLLLLSKKPIINPKYESLFPDSDQTLHRGLIEAQVDGIGKIVCTHLTSLFPFYFEYDVDFSSYAQQKLHEINKLSDTYGGSNHILAGDLNTGPKVEDSDPEKNLAAEAPESYELLKSKGYTVDTYLRDDGRCTFCRSNPMGKPHNWFIDDVLVMGNAFSKVTKQRVLDQTNPPLSDHYGVRATLCVNSGDRN